MKNEIDQDVVLDELFSEKTLDVNADIEKLFWRWDCAMKKSFHVVKQNKRTKIGVDEDLKCLLSEEKWIRNNVMENPERGKRIAEIQQLIGQKLAENVMKETECKVNKILESERPQSKVFQV